jgi:hypothetical protein
MSRVTFESFFKNACSAEHEGFFKKGTIAAANATTAATSPTIAVANCKDSVHVLTTSHTTIKWHQPDQAQTDTLK